MILTDVLLSVTELFVMFVAKIGSNTPFKIILLTDVMNADSSSE